MQIGAINGTSFKGLLICRPVNGNGNKVAINTDNIDYISEGVRSYDNNMASIVYKNGNGRFLIKEPFDIAVKAYEKAAKSSDSMIDLTNKDVDI